MLVLVLVLVFVFVLVLVLVLIIVARGSWLVADSLVAASSPGSSHLGHDCVAVNNLPNEG